MKEKLDFLDIGFNMANQNPNEVPKMAKRIEKEYGKRAKNTFLKGVSLALANIVNPYASGPYLDTDYDDYKPYSKQN